MNQSFLNLFAITSIVIFIYYNLCFIISIIKKRNDVADIAWGLGFIIAALCPIFLYKYLNIKNIITTTLVIAWGLRIALHIYLRNKGKKEDYRYAAWRESWGKYFYLRTYLQVFLLQGVLLIIIVSPVLLINATQASTLTVLDFMGIIVWIFGFLCESVADHQLTCFLKDPANKGLLLMNGLWRYSRHPNYFGEITQWWGLFLVALSTPWGFLTIIGPLTITFLIINISGIPLLEKKMSEHPAFEVYKNKTSMLIPWPPKNH